MICRCNSPETIKRSSFADSWITRRPSHGSRSAIWDGVDSIPPRLQLLLLIVSTDRPDLLLETVCPHRAAELYLVEWFRKFAQETSELDRSLIELVFFAPTSNACLPLSCWLPQLDVCAIELIKSTQYAQLPLPKNKDDQITPDKGFSKDCSSNGRTLVTFFCEILLASCCWSALLLKRSRLGQ